jgi:hypothetical protein
MRNLAVVHMTKALADQLGPAGITVNTVHPGVVETEHIHELYAQERGPRRHHAGAGRAELRRPDADPARALGRGGRRRHLLPRLGRGPAASPASRSASTAGSPAASSCSRERPGDERNWTWTERFSWRPPGRACCAATTTARPGHGSRWSQDVEFDAVVRCLAVIPASPRSSTPAPTSAWPQRGRRRHLAAGCLAVRRQQVWSIAIDRDDPDSMLVGTGAPSACGRVPHPDAGGPGDGCRRSCPNAAPA